MQKQLGQEITRINETKFISVWHGVPDSNLVLNFEPVIKAYGLTGTYCLLHWQAKPRNLRTWGIYCSDSKQYFSVGSDDLVFPMCQPKLVDVPESIVRSVPTAMILLEGVTFAGIYRPQRNV